MDIFDSRSMRYIDCFMQKFSRPGTFHYGLTTAAGVCLPVEKDSGFAIIVKERTGRPTQEGQQHNVAISRKGSALVANPPRLEIRAGDAVLWYTPDPAILSWMVHGEGEGASFSSSSMTSEAVYSHAFGTPGEYQWVDANNRRVSGRVTVHSLDTQDSAQCEKWMAALEEGVVILIEGDHAKPNEVEILTGQTVVWAVQKAEGISITDARLLPKDQSDH